MTQVLRQFLEGSNAKGARSSALHSLQWGLALIIGGLATASWLQSPNWVLILLGSMLAILFVVYILSYIYLLFRDRDALRSEEYTLSKMAIERGLVGDDISGLVEPGAVEHNLIENQVDDEEAQS